MTRALQNRLRRQQARRQVVFLVLACAAVTLLVALVFAFTSPKYPGGNGGGGEYPLTAGEYIEAPQETGGGAQSASIPPLTVGLGGDVSFGLEVAEVMEEEGPDYPWTDISALLGAYDFTAVNLEGPLCRGGGPNPDQPSYCMRGDATCAPPMAGAGIEAVGLANDHIMDYGLPGLEETLNILRGEEIGTFGAGSNARAAEQPLVLEAENGARLALLSFCDVAPPSYTAGENSPGIAAAALDRMGESIREAVGEAPYVVVFLHWGTIGSPEITQRQRELAHACVQAGADLVVGSHPHLVQGLEVWGGAPIIYSLGDLVFPSVNGAGKSGIIAGCRFDAGRLTGLEIHPLQVAGARPAPLAGAQAEEFLRGLAASSPGVRLDVSASSGTAYLQL